MNFAQVCVAVTCAVTAVVGCGDDRDAVGPGRGSPSALAGETARVTAQSSNHPPSAQHDWLTVAEDGSGSIDVTLNDTDADGDALSVTAVSPPDHGTATFAGAVITYTPDRNYVGGDTFEYTIGDGHGGMGVASVFVTVISVDDPPAAVDDTLVVAEDGSGAVNVLANDGDPDGDALAVTAFDQPAHGSVAVIGGIAIYTPAANYHGPDAFGYTVQDPGGLSSTATVHVTVTSVNDPPVAVADAASLLEDTPATIDVVANDSDVDGDVLAIASVTRPAHGAVAILSGHEVTYTPAADYSGTDAFSYTVADPGGATATATVTLTIAPVNDPPVAAGDAASLLEDGSAVIDVVANDSDVDGDALAIAAITQPAHGTAAIADGHHVTYTPAPDYNGADAFSYTIADPSGARATAAVAITVIAVNDPPVAVDDAASLDEDTTVTVDVVANDGDVDGDALVIAAITQPAHGLAAVVDGRVLYVPAADYHGPDALGYTISDGHGGQATAQLALQVVSVNDPPVAVADAASLDEDTAVTIDVAANDTDVDGDALAIAAITQPAHGTAAIADGHRVTYTPAPDYNGGDAFSYTIADGHGGQASAAVAVTVSPVNDPPVAADDAAGLDEDTSATIDVAANDTDVDGDALAVASITQPAHGAAAIVDATRVRYTPAANFHGGDAFSYTIADGHGGQATATVALAVASVNDPPVASSGTLGTFDDTPAQATLSGSDVDGDALSFAIATPPAHGTLGPVVGYHVTYTPAAGFTGSDSFAFAASDGQASSAPATIAVTVTRSVCGNGVREGVHEECDDGNHASGDGCEASCKLTCGSGTGADRATVDAASGHCFAAYDGVRHGYQEAAAMCTALGGHLPTIASASEDAAAFAAVGGGDTPWLGASDVAVEGTFGWLTGEPFSAYNHFHAGKPDNAGNADCVQYLADGSWSDAPCSGAATGVTGTLCELELAVTTPAFATGGGGTRAVAIADFNGDGRADVAAINPANNTVGILLGDGAGGFALQAIYATAAGPVAIAAGDLDGDGHPDLAVVNATASTVTVLRGTASGGFTAGATVAVAAGSTAIAIADLDQDGVLDLAVAGTGTVRVLHGDGSGGFTALGAIAVTGAPAAIAAGDLDRDGRVDLALTTPTAVVTVRATGGGAFAAPVTLVASAGNRGIVAADLDGDGNLDLAVASTTTGVTAWFGTGTGGFGAPSSVSAAGAPLVVAGDFDGDGATDLAAVTPAFATLFHGAGRTFTPAGPAVATGGGGAIFAAAARVNADAAADLVVANQATSTAGIVLGGAGGLVGARALPIGTGNASTVSADFNGDGRADLAIVDPPASKVYVFLQTAAGALVQSTTINTAPGGNASYAVAADFDGDGKLDLVIVNTAFNSISAVLGTGTGTFGGLLNVSTGPSPRRPSVGDFNGDGRPDLAVPVAGGNAVTVLTNNGGGHFGRLPDLPAGAAPAATAVGDFNGDGKKDIAVATTGEASVKLLLGHGDNTFSAAVAFPVASAGQAIAAADFDGDGKLDLAVTSTTAASVSLLRGTGTGGFAAATSLPAGTQPAALAAVDLDGDSHVDLVVGNAGSNDVTVLHGDGAGGFVGSSFPLGAPPSWVCVADFDRDGHLDIVAASAGPFVTLLYSGR